ncbi:MAG: methyltransferase, partial [Planctomycetes bacterium]|nr:methyltransferase [Planctomycetota bacterium]
MDRLARGPSLVDMRVLDLGCGVGAVGLAAARRGARVSFFDWEERAAD